MASAAPKDGKADEPSSQASELRDLNPKLSELLNRTEGIEFFEDGTARKVPTRIAMTASRVVVASGTTPPLVAGAAIGDIEAAFTHESVVVRLHGMTVDIRFANPAAVDRVVEALNERRQAAGLAPIATPGPAPVSGAKRASTQPRRSGNGIAAVVGGVSILWSLIVGAFTLLGIAAFIWGGTNSAHMHCLAHRYGDNSLLSTVACVVEH